MNIGYNRTEDPGRYGAVILAAGLSSRMKDFKPLLPVDGRPALTGLAECLQSAGIKDIVLVTGHRREDLQEPIRQLQLTEQYNENYAQGMFTSIQEGLGKAAEAFPDKKGFFLVPVDCPLITIRVLRELINAADQAGQDSAGDAAGRAAGAQEAPFFVPTFEGKKGHPLLVPRMRIPEILASDGIGGLKAITDRHWDQIVRVPVPDEEILLDMDTPEGYEAIQHFVQKGFQREKLPVLASRKRIILVRHGQTEQHEEPMFIGQYDVPLNDEGRAQARSIGDALAELIEPDVIASATWVEGFSVGKEPLPPIERVYSSDLSRARETAQIIADRINARYGGALAGSRGLIDAPTDDDQDVPAADLLDGSMDGGNVMNAMVGYGGMGEAQPVNLHVEVQPLEALREVALGDWDGRPIREVKETDPSGYARRGEDLFTYKAGNDGENFYDMQYRAVAALRDLLADDDGRNIIIVTHSGVIRALENNLRGLRVDDDWAPIEKGTYRIWTE